MKLLPTAIFTEVKPDRIKVAIHSARFRTVLHVFCSPGFLLRKFSSAWISISCFTAGISNSFSAVGHVYIPGFYEGRTMCKKNLSRSHYIFFATKFLRGPQNVTSRARLEPTG